MTKLKHIEVSGFKSIKEMKLDLGPLNVLIGANGSGKSNFLGAFGLLKAGTDFDKMREFIIGKERASSQGATGAQGAIGPQGEFIIGKGRASSLLHFGPEVTSEVVFALTFETENGEYKYRQRLIYGAPDTLVPAEHEVSCPEGAIGLLGFHPGIPGAADSYEPARVAEKAFALVNGLTVFQFHDTSEKSRIRRGCYVEDNQQLKPDAGNLAAFLYMLRNTRREYYRRIVETIRQAASFFDDFDLATQKGDTQNILLNWKERGSDYLFGPHQLSDGTLRFMALVTLLLQPEPPDVIIIDEPELGLHPYAINILASLVRGVATERQAILATQSALLVDQFEPEDVVVTERAGPETTFKRLDPQALAEWLKEYSLSELWEKNVLGGTP